MRTQTMDFEQRKKPGAVLKRDTQGIAPDQSRSVSPLEAGLKAAQAGLGNRYVQRMVDSARQNSAASIQAKLLVGAAQDEYEQEADRVAAQVMSISEQAPKVRPIGKEEEIQTKPLAVTIKPLVQRVVAPEEDDGLRAKFVQRESAPDEYGELQAKSLIIGDSLEPSTDFESRLAASRDGGRPLPAPTCEFMEQRFGADFSGVRVHTDGESAKLNRELNAQAFTHAQDIYLAGGQENIESNTGKQLLAHELTHVLQQLQRPIGKQKVDQLLSADGLCSAIQSKSGADAQIQRRIIPRKYEPDANVRMRLPRDSQNTISNDAEAQNIYDRLIAEATKQSLRARWIVKRLNDLPNEFIVNIGNIVGLDNKPTGLPGNMFNPTGGVYFNPDLTVSGHDASQGLIHELGHALQSMLGPTEYAMLESGARDEGQDEKARRAFVAFIEFTNAAYNDNAVAAQRGLGERVTYESDPDKPGQNIAEQQRQLSKAALATPGKGDSEATSILKSAKAKGMPAGLDVAIKKLVLLPGSPQKDAAFRLLKNMEADYQDYYTLEFWQEWSKLDPEYDFSYLHPGA